ncbi:Transcription initiation factor TFIID subunit 11 [Carex littledalei]|uniref:Transcription initiation factor TFIID subunit 11 n=1 Tax=Carex littledalei TaxID=544730 RepID=A0A833VHK5_9POAL|nr:Transcription initiation factor TFIID subunit 11 [Carex littledalei]
MKDPFEAAAEEQESPPESPAAEAEEEFNPAVEPDDDVAGAAAQPSTSTAAKQSAALASGSGAAAGARGKEDEEEEDEEHMEVDLDKLPPGGDPDKLAKMQAILSQFSEEQMNRYESFRRSGFQKSNMKKLLSNIMGTQKISIPTNIVVSGIAKLFVGELVETARVVMSERNDSGPIRPCHIRESYRRLKLEGKIPRRSVPRLFR